MPTLTFGELSFELRESSRRRTVGITVERDGSLVLATPPAVPVDKLEAIVNKRRFWIYTKLVQKESLQAPTDQKCYMPGEGFYYLGRSYRLSLVDDAKVPLRFYQSRFELLRSYQDQGRALFTHWYREHLHSYLAPMITSIAHRIEQKPRKYQIRELGNRWGSCSPKGDLYFHWRVALLPSPVINYVVIHEMTHLIYPHHNQDFWNRVERILPDWRDRKDWLAKNGMIYDI